MESTWEKKSSKTSKFMMQEVRAGIREKGINRMAWIDSE